MGKSYTELRREREEFRQKLVQLILCDDGPSDGTDEIGGVQPDLPSREERVVLRYYYYIRQGVDTVHVTRLASESLKRILDLVPTKLKKWKDLRRTLTQEVKVLIILLLPLIFSARSSLISSFLRRIFS